MSGIDPRRHAVVRVERAQFGTLPDRRAVDAITLRNAGGVSLRALTYGGIITSLFAPDRNGEFADIVLGFDTLAGYLGDSPYFGAIVGRYGNRIANGRFTLDGKQFALATNNGPNHLHGGTRGFDKVLWTAAIAEGAEAASVTMSYVSADGEEGYPGRLEASVTYTLNDRNELACDYVATTSAPTVVNLTQHSYFNLAGAGDVLAHELLIDAGAFTAVDETLIPTGELAPVNGTPFDFRVATPIGARIDDRDEQLRRGGGYDHNFVLAAPREAGAPGNQPRRAALVHEPSTGRTLEVSTTEPGLQFYSGNFLDGTVRGKGGVAYARRSGFCLETQHFPDSPNQPRFPSVVLRPGESFRSRTIFTVGVRR